MNAGLAYSVITKSPELMFGPDFLDDYATAQKIAQEITIDPSDGFTPERIKSTVACEMDLDWEDTSVLAVSALVAMAKSRSLRRPLWQNEKALRRAHWKILDLRPSTQRRLQAVYAETDFMIDQQDACDEAVEVFIQESKMEPSERH
jgi:hypothetical protein